jgi:hypothetical protein
MNAKIFPADERGLTQIETSALYLRPSACICGSFLYLLHTLNLPQVVGGWPRVESRLDAAS